MCLAAKYANGAVSFRIVGDHAAKIDEKIKDGKTKEGLGTFGGLVCIFEARH